MCVSGCWVTVTQSVRFSVSFFLPLVLHTTGGAWASGESRISPHGAVSAGPIYLPGREMQVPRCRVQLAPCVNVGSSPQRERRVPSLCGLTRFKVGSVCHNGSYLGFLKARKPKE